MYVSNRANITCQGRLKLIKIRYSWKFVNYLKKYD